MTGLPVESFIIERLQEGGWRVIRRRADLADLPIADFVSSADAEEWVSWKSSYPKINAHAVADDVRARSGLLEVAIEPKSSSDRGALRGALIKLADEDPEFGFSIDHQSGHTVLTGMSEAHIADKIDVLNRSYGIGANFGPPQVAFLERPTQRAEVNYAHKKFDGSKGEFAVVKLVIEPNEPGKGYRFESRIVGDAVPKKYIPGIERGIESVLSSGVVAGFPVVDVKVALVDGAYHDVDSSALAFEIASRAAFVEGLRKAKSVLLEPIMKLEVVTPDDSVSAIVGDLVGRRGQLQGRDTRGNVAVIKAIAPLINMFGFANTLREISQGRATFTMQFDRYAPTPLPDDDPPLRPAIGMRA